MFSLTVSAVLVTYNPNTATLRTTIQAVFNQVSDIFVVDNASSNFSPDWFDDLKDCQSGAKLHLLPQKENLGIAAAQNIGIEHAIELGANFVLLLDQDSEPSTFMVTELIATIMSAREDTFSPPVAAIGPATVDSRTGKLSFFVIEHLGIPRRWLFPVNIEKLSPFIEVGFLIASGTLIPIEVIKDIGAMRSNYFIDHVDTEWCFRAKAAGYRLLGVPTSRMRHQLGDTVKQIWFFGFRQVMYHSPLRDYYMFRNTLLMLRDTAMSRIWKIYFLWRLLQFAGYFLVFAEDRWLRLQRMSLGLLHGMEGKSGRFENKKSI